MYSGHKYVQGMAWALISSTNVFLSLFGDLVQISSFSLQYANNRSRSREEEGGVISSLPLHWRCISLGFQNYGGRIFWEISLYEQSQVFVFSNTCQGGGETNKQTYWVQQMFSGWNFSGFIEVFQFDNPFLSSSLEFFLMFNQKIFILYKQMLKYLWNEMVPGICFKIIHNKKMDGVIKKTGFDNLWSWMRICRGWYILEIFHNKKIYFVLFLMKSKKEHRTCKPNNKIKNLKFLVVNQLGGLSQMPNPPKTISFHCPQN